MSFSRLALAVYSWNINPCLYNSPIWNHWVRLWKFSCPKYDSRRGIRICISGAEDNQNQPQQHRKEAQLSVGTTWHENWAFGRRYAQNGNSSEDGNSASDSACNYRGDENDFSPRSTLTRLPVTGTRGPGCTGPVIRAKLRRVGHCCAAAPARVRTTGLSGRRLYVDTRLLGLER